MATTLAQEPMGSRPAPVSLHESQHLILYTVIFRSENQLIIKKMVSKELVHVHTSQQNKIVPIGASGKQLANTCFLWEDKNRKLLG